VEVLRADAATYPFSPFADLAVSRFGVMFFGDPEAAFANIRRALKKDARLVFACWREFDANPWMKVPLVAAYRAGLPPVPPPEPTDPGPFSFANPERVTHILTAAGFETPIFSPVDFTLDLAAGKGLASAVSHSLSIGATSYALKGHSEEMVAIVRDAVEAALQPHSDGRSVKLGAAIWIVESRLA
jgi:SAM-dependent methyltransferase